MTRIERYARELLDAAPDAMIIADTSGTIIYVNEQVLVLFGYSRDEMLGKQLEMLLPERFRVGHPALRLAYTGNPRLRAMAENQLLFARHRSGREFRVEIRLNALRTDDGTFISSTIRDVGIRAEPNRLAVRCDLNAGDRPSHVDKMEEARQRALITLNAMGDAVISTGPTGQVNYLNPMAEKMTGWSLADASGRPLKEVFAIVDDNARDCAVTPLQTALEELQVPGALSSGTLTCRDKSERAIEHSSAPILNDRGESIGAVTAFRDVSAARSITNRLAYAAHHDALTGLPNRVLWMSRLTHAIALARRHNQVAAVLFLDLDGFKLINDTLGHPVGDRLLESVGRALQRCVRDSDTVSRFGGDEFAILLSEISHPSDAITVAEKILAALRMPHSLGEHSLMVTASIGIGLFPYDGTDPQTLLRNADDAMFRAKRPGGNGYRFYSRTD